ncbi:Rv2175c family DNA-binding protein [Corynebacterium macclintockiae]|uniref:Rv2175c family DNA-binding protein n=1 Tax=Corynebacterium macclintockiae TaxID=2913501 RepID=UPI00068C4B25|nr:Rv2175c family DNA-binding protein [Corynebacterium macclintockiae]MDK8870157.1 Rv2175c family DNA-binding protein [Corynebacterium macclintockiae]MDK8889961.1 Rv2175c family DNA-binding protein [Corynebacterium macclintockiae]
MQSADASQGKILDEAVGGVPAGEEVLTLPDIAERMNLVVTRVMDMLGKKQLLAVVVDGVRYVPSRFLDDDGQLNRFVPGAIALLSDGGYSDTEILDYLFTEDDSLPGRPVDALHGHLAREVMRRAQAMAIL